jgi:hypothetical protein
MFTMLNEYELCSPSTPPDIRGKDRETAVDLMVQWFFTNFEDPVENTPRDAGDWVFIWGGPYYARDELEYAFGTVVTPQAIEEAVAKIEEEGGPQWPPSMRRMRPDTE